MLALPLRSSSPEMLHGKYVAGMFASGEQGVWYDPSDRSTLFQDAAGTIPVTGVEQPVGRIRDKSGRGNHATQTTTASRPTLSARVNLLESTENFAAGGWGGINAGSVSANQVVSPVGNLNADVYTENAVSAEHLIYSITNLSAGVSYKFSCYYKKLSNTSRLVILRFSAGSINSWSEAYFNLNTLTSYSHNWCYSTSVVDAGDGWYKCEAIFKELPSAATVQLAVGFRGVYVGDGTSSVAIWGADLRVANESANLPAYQRVNTATDYDTNGFLPYLRFDGVDDWLVTPSINFTGTDKMTVFCADACAWNGRNQALFGLGYYINSTNPGVFWVTAFDGNYSARTAVYLRQTLKTVSLFNPDWSTLGFNTNIRTISLDIAGASRNDEIKMRRNSVVETSPYAAYDASAGDGRFTNNSLYIGKGDSAPFNGRLYGLVIRGAQTDNLHLTNAERYLAHKTGVTL